MRTELPAISALENKVPSLQSGGMREKRLRQTRLWVLACWCANDDKIRRIGRIISASLSLKIGFLGGGGGGGE